MDSGYMTIVQHEEYEKRMMEEHERIHYRLQAVEDRQKDDNRLIISVEKMALNMEKMQEEQKKQGDRLEVLENRDGEMWRKVTSHTVMLIVGAVIAFMFDKIGM